MNIMTLGIDIAKNVFQLCGADASGKIVLRKRLTRSKLQEYLVQLPCCRVVMEACGSANCSVLISSARRPDFIAHFCPRLIATIN